MAGEGDARLQRVLDTMLGNISDRAWAPGARIPSEPKLAEAYGVSRSTIARATWLLRYLGFITGPAGGRMWIAEASALDLAWEAFHAARRARKANRLT